MWARIPSEVATSLDEPELSFLSNSLDHLNKSYPPKTQGQCLGFFTLIVSIFYVLGILEIFSTTVLKYTINYCQHY